MVRALWTLSSLARRSGSDFETISRILITDILEFYFFISEKGAVLYADAVAGCASLNAFTPSIFGQDHMDFLLQLADGFTAWLGYTSALEGSVYRWRDNHGRRFSVIKI